MQRQASGVRNYLGFDKSRRVKTAQLSETIGTDPVSIILIYSILMSIQLYHRLNVGVEAGINSEIKSRLQ